MLAVPVVFRCCGWAWGELKSAGSKSYITVGISGTDTQFSAIVSSGGGVDGIYAVCASVSQPMDGGCLASYMSLYAVAKLRRRKKGQKNKKAN